MKKTIFLFLVFVVYTVSSQEYALKYGKVTMDEMTMKAYSADSDAVAVILYEDMDFVCNTEENRFQAKSQNDLFAINFKTTYYYKTKIKILKPEGTSYGSITIPTYRKNNKNESDLSNIEACSYNLEDGKIVKTKLDKKYIFTEKVNDNITLTKIALPEVKVGSVIEYKYTIISNLDMGVPKMNIQHAIPVIYSKAQISSPSYFVFNTNVTGTYPLNITTETGDHTSKSFEVGNTSDPQNRYRVTKTIHYSTTTKSCISENVPALKDENYLWCTDDLRTKIDAELSAIAFPGRPVIPFSNTWTDVNELFAKSIFSSNLKTSYPFKDDVMKIKDSDIDEQSKIRQILKLVQSKIKWNKVYSFANPKLAIETGTGSGTDINFILISALSDAGFDCTPILLNPRQFGRLPFGNPTIDKIRHFVVGVKLGDELVYVDGTNIHSDINILPTELLADRARVYGVNDDSGWVNLTALSKNVITTNIIGKIDDDGVLTGSLQRVYKNQSAYDFANKYETYKDSDEYAKENIIKGSSLNIKKIEIDNSNPTAIKEKIDFSINLMAAGQTIYLNSLVFPFLDKNPFNQQERSLPIELNYPNTYKINCGIDIPDNYLIEETPDKLNIAACNNGVSCTYNTAETPESNNIQMRFSFKTDKIIYTPDEYMDINAFYGKLVLLSKNQIVLKQKSNK